MTQLGPPSTSTSPSRTIRNVGWNMVGGAWNGVLVITATPWFVSLLGIEGYSLLGFWFLMQMLQSLGDLGLGAALVREFADPGAQPDASSQRRDLLRTLECLYCPLAVLLSLCFFLSSDWIASRWLKLHIFQKDRVVVALQWMGLSLGLQFPCALYSSGLAGLQEHGRANALQVIGNTLRYVGGVAVLLWRVDPVLFFGMQAVVAGAQTLATRVVLARLIGHEKGRPPVFRWAWLIRIWRFSAGMAVTMIAGVLLANSDRFLLSLLVPAEEFGKYAVAFTATGILQMGIQPFYRAYFPRYSELHARQESERLRAEYYQSCRAMAGIILPAALIGGIFAPQIFMTWIGRADETIVSVFRWLLLGIACSGVMWLPAAFQQAHGWTRLHALMIASALAIGVPAMLWTIPKWGPRGATCAWVLHGVSDVSLGLWLMHRRLLPGECLTWFATVLVPPLAWSAPIVGLSWWLMPPYLPRWLCAVWLGMTGLLVVGSVLFVQSRMGKVQQGL